MDRGWSLLEVPLRMLAEAVDELDFDGIALVGSNNQRLDHRRINAGRPRRLSLSFANGLEVFLQHVHRRFRVVRPELVVGELDIDRVNRVFSGRRLTFCGVGGLESERN